MMGTASSLADVHLLCMAALGEVIWGPSQGDPGKGTTAQSDQCCRLQVESDRWRSLYKVPGKTLSFPYLQLVPPHCHTCRC